jgi:predicted XRE-type DNA-binding protein
MARLMRPLRPLLWIASSKRDYREFPTRVQYNFGFELFVAQSGQHPPSGKLLKLDQAAIASRRARFCRTIQEGDRMMARKVKVEMGSGNIFADLGLPDAEAHFLKAQIVSEIYRLTNERKLTQAQAGKRMGISQPEVSRMFKGNFREYSIDRLMGFLTSFDRDVEIVVKPHKRKAGRQGRIIFSSLPA